MKTVTLRAKRERSVARRHPWIFSGALEDVAEPIGMGETVAVKTAQGETLGYGWYSPLSQIRVRMLTFDAKAIPDEALIVARVGEAIGRRADYFVQGYTNALRLVNAENDGLPGVVADYYAGWVVCQFTSAGGERWKRAIAQALMDLAPGCKGVSERTDLKDREKEGLGEGRGTRARDKEKTTSVRQQDLETAEKTTSVRQQDLETAEKTTSVRQQDLETAGETTSVRQHELEQVEKCWVKLVGEEPPEEIEIVEGACKFLVNVRAGHKTGFYLDQRDARRQVGELANGADMLNCFAYTGGFGLFARACGAASVTQVDISGDALALAKKNEGLVHLCGTKMVYEQADVFQYLRSCRDAGRTFDMIVLDPPKFASVKSQVMKAARGYKDINLLAMKLLRPNGVLATFSCSGAMTAELFDQVLAEAAADAGRNFQILARTRQGSDHPVALAFPEGAYLKGVIMRRI